MTSQEPEPSAVLTPLSCWYSCLHPANDGLSPVQNEDFVWHLVLGTLLTLFVGTRPAGQVHRSVAHRLSQRPLASAVCPLATLPSRRGSHHLPTLNKQAGFPKRSHWLFSFVVMRNNDFPLARVNSHGGSTPPCPTGLITHTLSLWGLSREASLSI